MKIYNPTGFSTNLTGSFSGSVKGTLTATGNIIPDVSGAYDIGSTAFPFKDLYITQNSLKFIDDSTGTEIGRISVNSNTGDIKLLNTKNLSEQDKATLTAENAGADALSPVSASALWVSQSISPGHVNTDIGHDTAPFHTLYTQFISGSSATLTGTVTADTFVGTFDGALSSSIQIASDISGSFTSVSESFALDRLKNTTDTLDGDLTVTGKITAQEFHTEFVSASIIYESGSTKFGDSSDDVHEFTGSVSVSNGILGTLNTAAQTNITSLGTLSSLTVSGDLTVDTSTLKVDSTNNRVGIGTASPSYPLHVANSGIYHITAEQTKTNTSDADAYATFYVINNAGSSQLKGYFGAGGASVGNSAMQNHVYIGAQSNHGFRIFTNDSPKVTVEAGGNVGIGLTNPTGKLHVYNVSAVDTYLETGTSGTSGKLIFKTSDNSDTSKYIGQESYYMVFSGNANEGFKWRDSTSTILMSVFGTNNAYGGRVGIGTTTPTTKLEVNGDGKFVSNASSRVLYLRQNANNAGNIIQFKDHNDSDTWEVVGRNNEFYIYNTSLSQTAVYINPANGYVGINTTVPSSALTVNGTITESSALRYKENIETLTYGLDDVVKMRGVTYNKIETGVKEIGVIAEEVYDIIPELVNKNEDGEIESVSYGRLTAVLIQAIKELKEEIETLKNKN